MNHKRRVALSIIAAVFATAFGAVQAEVSPTIAEINCVGFDYPMDVELFMPVNRNRSALPLRATLEDTDGNVVTGEDLDTPPVVQVWFISVNPEEEPDWWDESELVPIHDADAGNYFEYYPLSEEWQFNLSARPLEALGSYTISMESGDTDEYIIPENEKCKSTFTRVR